jgi:TetR/AcrR family transcriptional regulator, acrAB operon repressor
MKRRRQADRTRRSRAQILAAALKLFSRCGYHGTSLRDIAEAAKASTGNVYHHFPDKESIFTALIEEYLDMISSPDHPFNRALVAGVFPTDLEAMARSLRQSMVEYREHALLVYVDAVEFEGKHLKRMYGEMADRFQAFLDQWGPKLRLDRLREGVSPLTAIMVVTRFFVQYFAVEIAFRVPNHFGKASDDALVDIVDVLQYGLLKR